MSADSPPVWHILTGEYPPAPGGVSDYTALVANGLAESGCEVHVWCPRLPGPLPSTSAVQVHQLDRGFTRRGLKELDHELSGFEGPRTLLVQYVYNAYGYRGMNVPFCLWLIGRRYRSGDDVRIMFHEPFYSFGWQSARRNVLAAVTHLMAALLLIAGRTIYLSIPAWERLLQPWNWLGRSMFWSPIPATIPGRSSGARTEHRERPIVGHFGTYGEQMRRSLKSLFTALLRRRSDIELHLLGGGSKAFAAEFAAELPNNAGRIVGFDRLPDDAVAEQIRRCDVMLQYYPDGVSSRRTSVMACLVNSVAVVTTTGWLSEPDWAESRAVALAPAEDIDALIGVVDRVLNDSMECARLASAGHDFYVDTFSRERTVELLTSSTAAKALVQ